MGRRINLRSTVNAHIGIRAPSANYRRDWYKKGAVHPIDADVLEEIFYDPGVEAMLRDGLLEIVDDMPMMIKLGLEEPDSVKPTNVIILSEADMDRYISVKPTHELRDILKKISKEQRTEFARYAIEKELSDMERAEIIGEAAGVDLITMIRDNKREGKANS